MDTINARLAALRAHFKMNTTDFARFIDVDRSRYARMESGPNKPALDAIEAIAGRIPDLSLDWLINGTGPMLRDGRTLVPVEAPATTAAPVVQMPAMQVVAESELVKELKEDRNYWREMALGLMGRDQAEAGKKPSPDSYSAAEALTIAPAGFGEGRGGRYAARTTMQVGTRAYAFHGSELLVIGVAEQDQEAA